MSENKNKTTTSNAISFQDALPLGYLYLIVLGIVSDSIYYGILGINIMSFSSVLDVLLSPVSQITENYIITLIIIFIPLFSYFYSWWMQKITSKKKKETNKPKSGANLSPFQIWLVFTAFCIFGAFVGMGIGKGLATSKKMASGKLEVKHKITFNDGKTQSVHILGNNSAYIFFVGNEEKSPSITPIQGNIKKIEKLVDF